MNKGFYGIFVKKGSGHGLELMLLELFTFPKKSLSLTMQRSFLVRASGLHAVKAGLRMVVCNNLPRCSVPVSKFSK